MEEQKNNQLEKQSEEKNLAPSSAFDVGGFVEGGIDVTDVKIPKALIVQAMSTIKRENKELNDGDLFLSTSRDRLLTIGEVIEFTPIYVEKLVQVFENTTGVPTYEGSKRGNWITTEPVTGINKDLPAYGEKALRSRLMACYSLFHSNEVPSIFPIRLDFKGSSKNAFQTILEKVVAHGENGEPTFPAAPQLDLVFELTVMEKVNSDNQAFYILNPKFVRTTTDQEKEKAIKLMEMVKNLSNDEKHNDSDMSGV